MFLNDRDGEAMDDERNCGDTMRRRKERLLCELYLVVASGRQYDISFPLDNCGLQGIDRGSLSSDLGGRLGGS